ncbi:hypothetical protein M3B54_011220 [Micrococcus luteus]|uniref:hypothetical protein n=1 Tax=Micrococcus luteus TaxID=1270 RepID=UPI0029DC0A2C|nr:hypothetical protein [Micrococcus luteus]MCV7616302.1 hypothetical protein [Micrococcus luteus]
MATIKSPGTWVDLNGQITCLTHAPMSLTARLEERPRLRTVTTTTTVWTKITSSTLTAWANEVGSLTQAYGLATCEVCRHHGTTR